MNICIKILKCGCLDLEFLNDLIDDLENYTEFSVNDVINEVKNLRFDNLDVNSYIYATLSLNALAIKEECIKYFSNFEDDIYNLEENIITNYLDSFYNSEFNEWDWWFYYGSKDKKEYIKNFLKNFDLEVQDD